MTEGIAIREHTMNQGNPFGQGSLILDPRA